MIKSIEEFITAIRGTSSSWPDYQPRWFRGEPPSKTPLVPTLYRGGLGDHENPLLQTFRARASGFHAEVPHRDHTDQWLFLARHARLPTRLLDWSESALVGLFFALNEKVRPAVVWMLNPLQLNYLAHDALSDEARDKLLREFPLPWHAVPGNGAYENICGAWEHDGPGVSLPVAVHPTYVHARLRGQQGCFTIHGKKKEGLDRLVPDSILERYQVDPASHEKMLWDLQVLGITDSVAFPDLDGLASELKKRFYTGH